MLVSRTSVAVIYNKGKGPLKSALLVTIKHLRSMITKIGENAGAVWTALQNGAQGLKALKKATKLKNEELYLALGWLAREGKLTFTEAEADTIIALA